MNLAANRISSADRIDAVAYSGFRPEAIRVYRGRVVEEVQWIVTAPANEITVGGVVGETPDKSGDACCSSNTVRMRRRASGTEIVRPARTIKIDPTDLEDHPPQSSRSTDVIFKINTDDLKDQC